MNIVIGGISAAGNLGAPALGITLKSELEKKYGKCNITLVMGKVNKEYFEYQKSYAERYGVNLKTYYLLSDICESLLINAGSIETMKGILKSIREYHNFIKKQDLFLEISGIAYYDIGKGYKATLRDFTDFFYAKIFGIPYIRFVQSFGPMNNVFTKILARTELKNARYIYTRGKASKSCVKSILKKNKNIVSFPDIALKLPNAAQDWAQEYIQKLGLKEKNYVVICPSLVMYELNNQISYYSGERYISLIIQVISLVCECNNDTKLLLLPHTYNYNTRMKSDYTICKILFSRVNHMEHLKDKVLFAEKAFDVYETKGIISGAKYAIVSRYHALVAALSTQTPCFVIGWNDKYRDLLAYYNLENKNIDVTKEEHAEKKISFLIQEYESKTSNNRVIISDEQNRKVIQKLEKAFELLWSQI